MKLEFSTIFKKKLKKNCTPSKDTEQYDVQSVRSHAGHAATYVSMVAYGIIAMCTIYEIYKNKEIAAQRAKELENLNSQKYQLV